MFRRAPTSRALLPTTRSATFVVLACATALVGCPARNAVPVTDAAPGSVVVLAQAPADRTPEQARRGVGWYPNVEVDADNRVHLAWVDADVGDVMYAVTAPGASQPGAPLPVETRGAVGGYLRMALAPGGAPVFVYAHQDDKSLHLAHRPDDRAAMKAAGAAVDDSAMPDVGAQPRQGVPGKADSGFVVEEIAFGEEVGRGASLAFDAQGRPAVLYYGLDKLRLARRPHDVPAFGPAALGTFVKRDVDVARASPRAWTDLRVLPDDSVFASWVNDVVTDARLRVGRIPSDDGRTVMAERSDDSIELQGSLSAVLPRRDGHFDVVSWWQSQGAVVVQDVDPAAPALLGERIRLAAAEGPGIARRGAHDSMWVLARVRGDAPGLVLTERNADGSARATRLDQGAQEDSWFDLAMRPDGRPVAVWFHAETRVLKLYAP